MATIFRHINLSLFLFILILVLINSSCKKEEDDKVVAPNVPEEAYSEEQFITLLKRGWYVAHYNPKGFATHDVYAFDGDSTLTYGMNQGYYYLSNPIVCTLEGIENIQYWTITGDMNNLHLETKDICGGVNDYILKYDNYSSSQSYLAPNNYLLQANIKLEGQDTTLVMNNFQLDAGAPSQTKMYFHLDGWNRYFIMHRIN